MGRLTDNDKKFGPLTFGKISWNPWILKFSSGGDEDDEIDNHLSIYWFGYAAQISLPNILPPFREKHLATSWDAATVLRLGRNYYFETFPREYGFSLDHGHLNVFLGRQTHDSSTTQDWGCFLPWTQWRHVRYSLYDAEGNQFWTRRDRAGGLGSGRFAEQMDMDARCPSVSFTFADFDKEIITAKTKITEREWRFGEGWFKWLSLFRKSKIQRSLDLQFSAEVGLEKGSWKGGTIGHSIEMLPGELHEAAFRRYCELDHRAKHGTFRISFIGKVD